ncbi:UvrD-helicase domain-containing protein [Rhizobium laguerreae]|uniref:UvrD-helicase domain-containing protein n=1 Tax=Rhizobium laguerreae TaxID=1076926 RepID=UPI001C8FDB46|nr:UvrD-helicase domain-containing protein [Rhizobium laguerreae]MBY3157182.1 UvrD-helicase domain-containing protein [Rhizobium laguerreae]
MNQLVDQGGRLVALTDLDKSYLFEAGAGSGKTSLLAGRVVGLMVKGVKPAHIVSVSFTELAASELLGRIFDFATGLAEGRIPADIKQAYPNGVKGKQLENLRSAIETIGDMTCTTIHGFCQKLLRPYPVEAGIDPGASILDPDDAILIFEDVLRTWMRERLSGHDMELDIITAMVGHDPAQAVAAIEAVAHRLRSNPDLRSAEAVFGPETARPFLEAVDAFRAWTAVHAAAPAEHVAMMETWTKAATDVAVIAGKKAHVAVVAIGTLSPGEAVVVKTGGYRKYRLKTAWKSVSKTDCDRLNEEGIAAYNACCEAFDTLKEAAAAAGLKELETAVRPVLTKYAEHKRESALLDFDDLLYRTRDLLRYHDGVRQSLRDWYTHILVDEFQDTDPVQTEIFKMLSFEMFEGVLRPCPGAIFFVGDPKQSIYRFRGADVSTYVAMREEMRLVDPQSVRSIFVNFRSTSGIIDFVNATFEKPLADPRQPGFTALASHRGVGLPGPAVMKYQAMLDAGVDDRRKLEAENIADAVFHLITNHRIAAKNGTARPCTAGDIALLAPVNTSLFWLENALEDRGIPVSTQAGKGLFQQQEVKDLIALTRVLADHRDTLALGALLRGSFFGYTDDELLDVSAALPPTEDGRLPFLTLQTAPSDIKDLPLAGIVAQLAQMRTGATYTTPFDSLCSAIDMFDIRSKTRNRDQSNASRRLANIERYLDLSRAFDVRGIRAFSDAMREKWENAERVQEGKPGGLENSVSIITIHSSKGLEWPVVFTVNCATEFNNKQSMFSDIRGEAFAMKFLKQKPTGFDAFVAECRAEDHAERVRLMYVGLTRARDLLVVPDIPSREDVKAWADLVDHGLDALSYLDAPKGAAPIRTLLDNGPTVTKEQHQEILEGIDANRTVVRKRVPSSHEFHVGFSETVSFDDMLGAVPDLNPYAGIEGGVERGNVLHKLMEEILTGETDVATVEDRARELIVQVAAAAGDKAPELHAREIAECVKRTMALPEIVAILPRLVPEMGTSGSRWEGNVEILTMGVSDAMAFDQGKADVVVDWKGDLRPSTQTVGMYKAQVGDYVKMAGARRGLIVFMSTGNVVEVRSA